MASREELLQSIQPGMRLERLDKNFFLKIYGYELTWPGFAEVALTKLQGAGCNKARNYYTCIVVEYQYNDESVLKNVAEWYVKQDFYGKKVNESRKKQQEAEQMKMDLHQKSDRELLTLLQNLKARNI